MTKWEGAQPNKAAKPSDAGNAAPTQPQQQQDGQKQEAQKQGQQQNGASTSTTQQQGQANSTSTSLTSAGAKAAAAAAAGGGREGARPWAGPKIQFPPVKADAGDGKILLLFDLNGVLTEKTPARIEGKWVKRDHIVRPFIEELLRLYPHFRIGVFSSATVRTVNTALETLYAALQRITAQKGIDGLLLPKKYDLFNVICFRDHCQPDPYWQTRKDGKDHDTIKPLAKHGFDLSRTVLVDNDDYKAADGEHENMLHVPHWEQTPVTDRDFPLMVQLILRHLKGVEGDVRPHLRQIERQLRQLRDTDDTRRKAASDRTNARALSAATSNNWAGDASVREALAAVELAAAAVSSAPAAAAAAGAVAAPDTDQQVQARMKQFAVQGLKVSTAAGLADAPPQATQLVQLLSLHKAHPTAAAADTAVADVSKLLGDAHAEAAETYNQHLLVLLMGAAWCCNVTVPAGAFTVSQLTDLLTSRGWPTAHAAAALEAMIRGGAVKVWGPAEQQQQQQQWPWPDPPGHWPASAAPIPATVVPAAAPGAAAAEGGVKAPPPPQLGPDCWLLLPEPRSKQLVKSVEEMTSFLATATSKAVAEVVRCLEYHCLLQLVPEEQLKPVQQQQRKFLAGKASAEERNRPVSLASSWFSMLSAAVRDATAAPGVTAQQLQRFVQGLAPPLAQQLLGPGPQQQQQRLQSLLQQLEGVVKEVKITIKDKRQKGILGAPWAVFAANPLTVCRQQKGGDAAAGQHVDATAAAALTRYAVGILPNPDAVARSIRVLLAGAAAADAAAVVAAVETAKQEQQQQLDQHGEQQGAAPVHVEKQKLKPPVGACISVSPNVNLPAVVTQWLVQCQQQDQQQQQQQLPGDSGAGGASSSKQDNKRQREGAGASSGAAAAAAGSASKRQKKQQEGATAGVAAAAAAEAAGADVEMTSAPAAAAAAAAEPVDGDADLDALYEAEEQQRQLQEDQEAAESAAAATELALALGAGEEGGAATAAVGFEGVGDDAAAAAAAAGAVAAELLLPDLMDEDGQEEDGDQGEGEEEGGDEDMQGDEQDKGGDNSGDEGQGPGLGEGGDGDSDDGGDGGQGGAQGDTNIDGGAAGGSQGQSSKGDAAAADGDGEPGADGPGSGSGSDSDVPGDESTGDSEDGDPDDREDGWEFEGELGSEDDSEVWATDDEADGQLQLGITGLQEEKEEGGEGDGALEGEDAAAADAADSAAAAAADAAAAEVAAAMAHSAAAAAAAGQQVRGCAPLYGKLHTALTKARQAGAAAGSSGSSGSQQQQPSRLHLELVQFASVAAPCALERLIVERALQQLQGTVDKLWPGQYSKAQLFGSQAVGLALPGSDLDVVLLQVPGCPNSRKTDKGYGVKDRKKVNILLQTFANGLRREGYASKKGMQVIVAKVPILKGTLLVHIPQSALMAALFVDNKAAAQQLGAAAAAGQSANGRREMMLCVEMQVDISIGIADSAAAVNYVQRQVSSLGPLRPLLLAAKALLRESGLNEVFTGGLGSYALALLVISHLQAEGVADPATSAMLPSDLASSSRSAATAAAAAGSAAAERQQQQQQLAAAGSSGGQQWDLGLLLQGFFLRFGALFDYKAEAVVVNQGGVLAKPRQWVKEKRPFLLSVEDPAMPGRDMSSGSFAIRDVRAAFMRAATTLRELTTSHEDTGKGPNQHTTSTAAAGGAAGAAGAPSAALQQSVAAAAAAAVLAGGKKGGVQPQTPQQQHQQRQAKVTFDVVEDREAWSAVQADGQSRSSDVGDSPAQPAAAAAGWNSNRGNNINHSSSAGSLFGVAAVAGMGAVAASIEQQLGQGLREGLGMLGRLVDVVAAVGRGAAADAHRSELARQAALRGQARATAQLLQLQQEGGAPGSHHAAAIKQGKAQKIKLRKQLKLKSDVHKKKKPFKTQQRQQQSQQQKQRGKKQHGQGQGQGQGMQQAGGAQGGRPQQGKKQKQPKKQQQGSAGQPQGQPQGQQQQQQRATRSSARAQRRLEQRRQQHGHRQGPQQPKQRQQAGRKRPRDGGAAAGGGGRGWSYE